MWPVLDTGKNSVSPSIIARITASKEFIFVYKMVEIEKTLDYKSSVFKFIPAGIIF